MNNSNNTLIIIIFGIIIVIGNILIINYKKHKIRESAIGKTILNISFHSERGWWGNWQNYFEVDYKDDQGQINSCNCKVGLFSDVEWNV
jgi:hypothetical protein